MVTNHLRIKECDIRRNSPTSKNNLNSEASFRNPSPVTCYVCCVCVCVFCTTDSPPPMMMTQLTLNVYKQGKHIESALETLERERGTKNEYLYVFHV